MNQQQIITDFTQGELSPRLMGRFDLPHYYKGAKELTNMVPFFPGGVTYRAGFKRIGAAKGSARLHPFIISPAFSYILEFGPLYIRFWRSDALVSSGGNPIEVVTPWSGAQLWNLQFAQSEAKLYIASGTAPVKILEMTAADSFTFADLPITGITGQLPFQGAGNYPKAIAIHDGRLYLANTDNEPQAIWASKPFDLGNFTYYETISNTSRQLREPLNDFTADTTTGSVTLANISAAEIANFRVGDRITGPGIVDKNKLLFVGASTTGSPVISSLSSSVVAQLDVGETIGGQNIPITTIVSKGANAITLADNATGTSAINTFERDERRTNIATIGTNTVDVTIAATATQTAAALIAGWADPTIPEYQDVTNTRDVVTSASALKKEIASDMNESILWLAAGRDLVVGTTTGERVIPTGINSVTFQCRRQTAIGSAAVQPKMVNNAVLFVEGHRRGAREYLYQQEQEAYTSPSLTALADHMLASKVKEMDYQTTPQPIVYFTTEIGDIAACAYSREHQMLAWYKIIHGNGFVKSLAITPGPYCDEIYIVVQNGAAYNVEKMGRIFDSDEHLDSAGTFTKTNGGITGAAWLDGAAAAVYNNRAYDITISDGSALLPDDIPDGGAVVIGKKYTGRIVTMPMNAQARIGSAHMRPKVVTRLVAKILSSYSFKVGYDGGTMEQAGITGPVSGDYQIPVSGTWDTEGSVLILQDEPYDLTILAIAPEADAGG